MGFLQPAPPPFDLDEWRARPFLARLKPNAQDWVLHGFGAPGIVYVLYTMKLIVFVAGGFLITWATTPDLGRLGDVGHWWLAPIVFQKLAVWTLLWEILGLGSGSMQLTGRFSPLIGGALYWLRPGTVRLPPWPDKVPLTKGYRRTVWDVALYVGVVGAALYLLTSPGEVFGARRIQPGAIIALLVLWGLLGLRDKVPFLAARPEVYGFVLLVSLFSLQHAIAGWQFVFFFIWAGAAMSKLNRHFPFVVAVMVSNTPWNRSARAKEKMYRHYPEDLRPSRVAMLAAHIGTAYEFGLPLTMMLTRGGALQTIAIIGMIAFHAHILSTIPMGVPLEWNLFMIFGIAFLFGHYGAVPLSTVGIPLLVVLILLGAVIPILGNLFPEKFSFLLSMRYYAGNWASSTWLFRKDTDAEGKLDRRVSKVARIGVEQLAKVYDRDTAQYVIEKGMAFRAMHSHGRALTGLLARAVDDVEGYLMRDGEIIAGIVAGWNFGDGHFHDHHLLEAVQEQASFEPGELRAIMLESQPIQKQRQRYRIFDAATGLLEEGWVDVAEMCRRGPWLEESWEFPVEVTWPVSNVASASRLTEV